MADPLEGITPVVDTAAPDRIRRTNRAGGTVRQVPSPSPPAASLTPGPEDGGDERGSPGRGIHFGSSRWFKSKSDPGAGKQAGLSLQDASLILHVESVNRTTPRRADP